MPKYSIQAEEQSLFAFLKQAFFKMPNPVRVFAYLVFLFLFSFLTLYEFLGFTYYEGKVIYVSVSQQNPGLGIRDARPPKGMRVYKGDRDAYVNERGEFVIGIRSMTIPFLTVNFDFDDGSPEGEETVAIPTPFPLVSLFNPNEREIYYVPGNTIKEADESVRHYFLDRKEAHEALKKSLQSLQPTSSSLLAPSGSFAPSVVHAAEPAVGSRSYYLSLTQLRVPGNDDDPMDVYFAVQIDGLPVRAGRLPTADSSELSHVKISRDTPYQFADVTLRIPENANHVEIAAYRHRSLFQKDQLVGSVGIEPRNTSVGPVTLSDGHMQLTGELFPPVAIASASVPGKGNVYVVGVGLDIPLQYLNSVKSLEYDLGPGYDEATRIIKPPTIDRSDLFVLTPFIYAPQPISAHVEFNSGGSLDLRGFCDTKPRSTGTIVNHYLRARAFLDNDQAPQALEEITAALKMDSQFTPALALSGEILGEMGQFDAALGAYRRALELDPRSASMLNGYAWVIADKVPQPTTEQLEDAKRRAQLAISLLPDSEYYDTLGWVLYKLHDYRGALDALNLGIQIEGNRRISNWQDLQYHLARTYVRLGNNPEAKKAFREVVNYGQHPSSNDRYVRDAKSQLSTLQARLTPNP